MIYGLLSIIILSAIFIMYYDIEKQEIPIALIIINYACVCLLVNPYLLIGEIFVFIAYKNKIPIDPLYLFLIVYLIIIKGVSGLLFTLSLLLGLIFIFVSKKKVSFMVPLEVILISALL